MVRYATHLPHWSWWLVGSLFWLLSTTAAFAGGAKVVKIGASQANIAASQPDGTKWVERDRLCVIQLRSPIACGRVVKSTSKGVIIKLDAPSSDIIAGDIVVPESQALSGGATGGASQAQSAPARSEPTPKPEQPVNRRPSHVPSQKAQLLDSVKKHPETEDFDFNLSAGTGISFSFFYPVINLQVALAPNWALGLIPMALFSSTDQASLRGLGGYLALNYYNQSYFRGLWVQGGAGLINFSVSSVAGGTESASVPAGILTAGWRGYWDLGLNIGVGAGLQYVSNPSFSTITVQSAGILPLVILDVGVNF